MPYDKEKNVIHTKLQGVRGTSAVANKKGGIASPSFSIAPDSKSMSIINPNPEKPMLIGSAEMKMKLSSRQFTLKYLYHHPENLKVLYRDDLDIIAQIELTTDDVVIICVGQIKKTYQGILNLAYATRIKSWQITGMDRKLRGEDAWLGMNVTIDVMPNMEIDLNELSSMLD